MEQLVLGMCLVAIGYLASLIGIFYGNLRELKGEVKTLKEAPVLRQYIERFVPIDNSVEAKQKLDAAMIKASEEFNKMFGMELPQTDSMARTPRAAAARAGYNEFMDRQKVEDLV